MTAPMEEEPTSEAAAAPPAKSYREESDPIVVIGEKFIVPYPVELSIQHTVFTVAENYFDITDDGGNPVFKARDKLFSFPNRRVLFDAAGNPLVSLRKKILSVHRRWKVFRGESEKSSEFLFSVKKSSSVMRKTNTKTAATLDVFLASNTSESKPDFRIKEKWGGSTCTVFHGDVIIAEMHRNHNLKSLVINADNYGITAYPNVDYAFTVALLVILDDIKRNGDA